MPLALNDQSYELLPKCHKLEELGISNAENLSSFGISAISKLHHLKILKLNFAKNVTSDDFMAAFGNKNLQHLLQLDLSRCLGMSINNSLKV